MCFILGKFYLNKANLGEKKKPLELLKQREEIKGASSDWEQHPAVWALGSLSAQLAADTKGKSKTWEFKFNFLKCPLQFLTHTEECNIYISYEAW